MNDDDKIDYFTSTIASALRGQNDLSDDARLHLAISLNIILELFDQYAFPCEEEKLLSSYWTRVQTEFALFDEVKIAIETGQPVGDAMIDAFIGLYISPDEPLEEIDLVTYAILTLIAFDQWAFEQELNYQFMADFHKRFIKQLPRYQQLKRDMVVH